MSDKPVDHSLNAYDVIPKRMRDLDGWVPSVALVRRALVGHEILGLEDQPMTPRHKVFIALAYAYAVDCVTEENNEASA